MKSRKFLKKKVLEVLVEALNGKRNPAKLAKRMMAGSGKVPIKNQLQKLKFSNSDIALTFQLIFEAITKADADKYYPMEEIDGMFNLTGKS